MDCPFNIARLFSLITGSSVCPSWRYKHLYVYSTVILIVLLIHEQVYDFFTVYRTYSTSLMYIVHKYIMHSFSFTHTDYAFSFINSWGLCLLLHKLMWVLLSISLTHVDYVFSFINSCRLCFLLYELMWTMLSPLWTHVDYS